MPRPARHAGAAHLLVQQPELFGQQPLLECSLSFVHWGSFDARGLYISNVNYRVNVQVCNPSGRGDGEGADGEASGDGEGRRGGPRPPRCGRGRRSGASQRSGMSASPYTAPARAPVTAPTVSASLPMFTARHRASSNVGAAQHGPQRRAAGCRARRRSSGPLPARPRPRLAQHAAHAAGPRRRGRRRWPAAARRSSPCIAAASRSLKAAHAQPASRSKWVSMDSRCDTRAGARASS